MSPLHARRPARAPFLVKLIALCVVSCCVVLTLGPPAGAGRATTSASAQALPTHPRPSRVDLQLVSRTFDSGTGQWTVVVGTRLDSNRACIPAVFDCIVQPGSTPAGATLTDVQCLSPWWGHLGIFTSSCLKQLFHAGHHQRFRYTYVTDAGSAPTELELSTDFGRGLFPIMLERLASASLTVSLTADLDLVQECPTDTLQAGASFSCTVQVSYPLGATPGVPVSVGTLGAALGGTAPSTATGLTTTSPDWSCAALLCTLTGQIDPGDVADFTLDATADNSTVGGELTSTATLDYGSPTQQRATTDQMTVAGSGDTDLTLTKSSDQTTAQPGQAVSWTVTLTNVGVSGSAALPAADVVLADLVPDGVTNLSIAYASGVGSWSCAAAVCTTASMPPGSATFRVQATVAPTATAGSNLVNEVDVSWTNDVIGPDTPVVAGASITIAAPTPTPTTTTTTVPTTSTTTPTAAPARLAFTG